MTQNLEAKKENTFKSENIKLKNFWVFFWGGVGFFKQHKQLKGQVTNWGENKKMWLISQFPFYLKKNSCKPVRK